MTIGELIDAMKADERTKSDAAVALGDAQAALQLATEAAASSDQALADGLALTGPVFAVLEDGTAEIYTPDGAGNYQVTTAKPVGTTVEGT